MRESNWHLIFFSRSSNSVTPKGKYGIIKRSRCSLVAALFFVSQYQFFPGIPARRRVSEGFTLYGILDVRLHLTLGSFLHSANCVPSKGEHGTIKRSHCCLAARLSCNIILPCTVLSVRESNSHLGVFSRPST